MMKNILSIILVVSALFSCNQKKKGRAIDFNLVKVALQLTENQEKKYNATVTKYNQLRKKQIEELKASGEASRKTYLKIIKASYVEQEQNMKLFLNNNQATVLHEFIIKNMPGQSDYSDELKQSVITTLALDSLQVKKYHAVNKAFEKAFLDAHDHYHGNSKAANMYWNQFNEDRTKVLKKIFTKTQFKQYLKLVEKESYRGKNNKE